MLILNDEPVFEDRLLAILDDLAETEMRVVRNISDAVQVLMAENFDGFVVEGDTAAEAATIARQHFPSLKILCAPRQRPDAEMLESIRQQQIELADGAGSGARLRRPLLGFLESLDAERPVSAEGIDPCHSLIGNLNQFSAAEILQMACLSQRTGRFTFKSKRGNSEIYLQHGAVRHSMYGTLEGEEAVAEIFRWRQGRFYFEEGIISHIQTVDRPWAHLLIDNLQKLDETLGLATVAPHP